MTIIKHFLYRSMSILKAHVDNSQKLAAELSNLIQEYEQFSSESNNEESPPDENDDAEEFIKEIAEESDEEEVDIEAVVLRFGELIANFGTSTINAIPKP